MLEARVSDLAKQPDQYILTENILQRQQALLKRIDDKATQIFTLLGLTSGIVAFLVGFFSDKMELATSTSITTFLSLLIAYFAVLVLTVIFAMKVYGPHEKPKTPIPTNWGPSISFYADILKSDATTYAAKMQNVKWDEVIIDNSRQIFILAGILRHKNHNLRNAFACLPVLFSLIVLLGVFSFL